MDSTSELKLRVVDQGGTRELDTPEDGKWCTGIAERIGSGDTDAESLLMGRLRPGLKMILYARCGHDVELAADLCQDTLLIVLNRLRNRSIDDPSRLAAFAAQTARQLAFDARRRFATRNTVVDSEAVDAAIVESLSYDTAEKASMVSLVRQLLSELSHDRDREVLRRFYLLEQEKAEICRSFGLAPGTFDQLVFRARARLRALLDMRGVASRDLLSVVGFWIPKSWLD
jgi:RNA polymerase sigma-70 factor, ECF subfamily